MKKIILWLGLPFVIGCHHWPRHHSSNENPVPEQDDGVSHEVIYEDDILDVELFRQAEHPTYRSLAVYYQMDPFDLHLDFFIRKVPDESGDLFLYYTHPHQDFNWSARIKSPEEIELQSLWWNGDRIYPPPDNDNENEE